jgi:transposase-like protein
MPKKVICPKCKSSNVEKDLSAEAYAKGAFFNQYRCKNCGFRGIFPEIEEKS